MAMKKVLPQNAQKRVFYNGFTMKLKFKKALVTGGAGFIGSHLVDALVSMDCDVTVLDNLSTGHLSNLKHIQDRITFYKGDIRDQEILYKASKDCNIIFHQAAVVSVPQTVDNPVDSASIQDPLGCSDLPRTASDPISVFGAGHIA